MSDSGKFTYESIQDTESVRDYVRSILTGLETGRITLASNGDEIVLEPAALLKFTVKARKKDDGTRLSIKLSWKDAGPVAPPAEGMQISTGS